MSVLEKLTNDADAGRLPSLPIVGLKIMEAVKGDVFSVNELTAIISTDPALASRTLRMANSNLYSHLPEVDSIERAVTLLGAKSLKNLALAFVIVKEMTGDSTDDFDFKLFWRAAVTSAVAAETLTQILDKRSDDTFVTSLLMNIGMLVMYSCRRYDYKRVLRDKSIKGGDISDIEKGIFGYDHQEVGKEILRKWNIPDSIAIPIAYHHDITDCPTEFVEAANILKVSSLTSSAYANKDNVETLNKLYRHLRENYDFDGKKVNDFVDLVAEKTVEVLDIYNIESDSMRPYSELMEEANLELSKLNVSYERIVIELTESKRKAEKLAEELTRALANIKTLNGMLPICATCKKIRDDKGYWNKVESYIQKHTDAEFTHGICPECAEKMLEEVALLAEKGSDKS